MTINLDALEALARDATGGERWCEGSRHSLRLVFKGAVPGKRPVICYLADGSDEERAANARFIAACDPQTILELVKIARKGEQS